MQEINGTLFFFKYALIIYIFYLIISLWFLLDFNMKFKLAETGMGLKDIFSTLFNLF
jgi:hypothetical protein